MFKKDGTCIGEQTDRQTGKLISTQGGTFAIKGRRIEFVNTSPGNEGRTISEVTLLRANRMHLQIVGDDTTGTYEKVGLR